MIKDREVRDLLEGRLNFWQYYWAYGACRTGRRLVEVSEAAQRLSLSPEEEGILVRQIAIELLQKDGSLRESKEEIEEIMDELPEGCLGRWARWMKGVTDGAGQARGILERETEKDKRAAAEGISPEGVTGIKRRFETVDRVAHLMTSAYTQIVEDSVYSNPERMTEEMKNKMRGILDNEIRVRGRDGGGNK